MFILTLFGNIFIEESGCIAVVKKRLLTLTFIAFNSFSCCSREEKYFKFMSQ